MSPVPAAAITIADGEITVDAGGTLVDRLSIMLIESLAPAVSKSQFTMNENRSYENGA